MNDATSEPTVAEAWPDCDSEQVRVMLLGTYHMDDPGLDEVNRLGVKPRGFRVDSRSMPQ